MVKRRAWAVGVGVALLGLAAWVARPSAPLPPPAVAAFHQAPEAPPAQVRSERPKGTLDISGVVTDAHGPVAGASVVALAHLPPAPGCDGDALGAQHEARPEDEQPFAQATTDAAGAFVLSGLTAGDFALWASAGEQGALRSPVAAGAAQVALALLPGLAFDGRVFDEQRKPLAGAHLKLLRCGQARAFEADSDAAGAFRFERVPRGDYVLWATHEGFGPEVRPAQERGPFHLKVMLERPLALTGTVRRGAQAVAGAAVRLDGRPSLQTVSDASGAFSFGTLPPSTYTVVAEQGGDVAALEVELSWLQHGPLQLELQPCASLRGDVVDEQGAPVAGAAVRWSGASSQTDAAGAFALTGLSAGRGKLQVAAAGYVEAQVDDLTLRSGEAATQHVALKRAAALRGHVLDEQHRPVAGASVLAYPLNSDPVSGTTDASGAFALAGLPVGVADLTVTHEAFAELLAEATAPAEDVVLVLKAGLAVRGKVLDAQGAPAPHVPVTAFTAARHHRVQVERTTKTDAQGSFALRGLTPGSYAIVASERNADDEAAAEAQQEVTLGARDAEVELRLKATRAIRGRVLDGAGVPVDGATVTARASDGASPSHRATADAEGHFEVLGLEDVDYEVRAGHPGYLRGEDTTAHAGATVELVLVRLGRAKGRAVHPDGTPVALYDLNGRTIDDPGGAFDQGGRDALILDFTLDGVTTRRTVEVKPGEVVELPDVVLGASRTVQGRVVDALTRAPLAGASVHLPQAEPVVTQADGRFALRAELGPVTVEAERDGHVSAEQPVPPEQSEVEVALMPEGAIEGTVKDAQGRPFSQQLKAWAFRETPAHEASQDHASEQVGADGRFRLVGLAPGSYAVRVAGPTSPAISPVQVTVAAGATAHVELVEPATGAEIDVSLSNAGHLSINLVSGSPPLPTTESERMQVLQRAVPLTATESGVGFQKVQAGHYTLLCTVSAPGHRGMFSLPLDSDGATQQRVTVTVPAQVQPLAPR
jgi:protocatechuate 3,4-dioxygenase beta subunit